MEGFWLETCKFLGSQAFANLAIGLGVLVAVVSVKSAHTTAKRKQTADLLFGTRADAELSKGYMRLQTLHNATDANMRSFAAPDRRNSVEANEIRYVLNHWERVCVGVKQGIYCEDMLREANYSTITDLYTHATPFIAAVREATHKNTYYQELESLAKRWKKRPLKVILKD